MFERFTDEARHAVVAAQAEARALKATRIETAHLFMGILDTAGSDLAAILRDEGYTRDTVLAELAKGQSLGAGDARALESIGIDLEAVRANLEASFGEGALDRTDDNKRSRFGRTTGHIAFASASKRALKLSLREALARKDSEIRCEHILLGLIRGADEKFTVVVDDPDRLRRRLESRAA